MNCFQIIKVLGRGSQGIVFLVEDKILKEKRVIKQIPVTTLRESEKKESEHEVSLLFVIIFSSFRCCWVPKWAQLTVQTKR